ncbi:unnamed protein product [Amoebophrya sp. A120]|nr:unnamed protein product [Amoebophrya sp. A120]|eukprot:GSA120T00008421001.1
MSTSKKAASAGASPKQQSPKQKAKAKPPTSTVPASKVQKTGYTSSSSDDAEEVSRTTPPAPTAFSAGASSPSGGAGEVAQQAASGAKSSGAATAFPGQHKPRTGYTSSSSEDVETAPVLVNKKAASTTSPPTTSGATAAKAKVATTADVAKAEALFQVNSSTASQQGQAPEIRKRTGYTSSSSEEVTGPATAKAKPSAGAAVGRSAAQVASSPTTATSTVKSPGGPPGRTGYTSSSSDEQVGRGLFKSAELKSVPSTTDREPPPIKAGSSSTGKVAGDTTTATAATKRTGYTSSSSDVDIDTISPASKKASPAKAKPKELSPSSPHLPGGQSGTQREIMLKTGYTSSSSDDVRMSFSGTRAGTQLPKGTTKAKTKAKAATGATEDEEGVVASTMLEQGQQRPKQAAKNPEKSPPPASSRKNQRTGYTSSSSDDLGLDAVAGAKAAISASTPKQGGAGGKASPSTVPPAAAGQGKKTGYTSSSSGEDHVGAVSAPASPLAKKTATGGEAPAAATGAATSSTLGEAIKLQAKATSILPTSGAVAKQVKTGYTSSSSDDLGFTPASRTQPATSGKAKAGTSAKTAMPTEAATASATTTKAGAGAAVAVKPKPSTGYTSSSSDDVGLDVAVTSTPPKGKAKAKAKSSTGYTSSSSDDVGLDVVQAASTTAPTITAKATTPSKAKSTGYTSSSDDIGLDHVQVTTPTSKAKAKTKTGYTSSSSDDVGLSLAPSMMAKRMAAQPVEVPAEEKAKQPGAAGFKPKQPPLKTRYTSSSSDEQVLSGATAAVLAKAKPPTGKAITFRDENIASFAPVVTETGQAQAGLGAGAKGEQIATSTKAAKGDHGEDDYSDESTSEVVSSSDDMKLSMVHPAKAKAKKVTATAKITKAALEKADAGATSSSDDHTTLTMGPAKAKARLGAPKQTPEFLHGATESEAEGEQRTPVDAEVLISRSSIYKSIEIDDIGPIEVSSTPAAREEDNVLRKIQEHEEKKKQKVHDQQLTKTIAPRIRPEGERGPPPAKVQPQGTVVSAAVEKEDLLLTTPSPASEKKQRTRPGKTKKSETQSPKKVPFFVKTPETNFFRPNRANKQESLHQKSAAELEKQKYQFQCTLVQKYGSICQAFEALDIQKRGKITVQEFMVATVKVCTYNGVGLCKDGEEAKELFHALKTNGVFLMREHLGIDQSEWDAYRAKKQRMRYVEYRRHMRLAKRQALLDRVRQDFVMKNKDNILYEIQDKDSNAPGSRRSQGENYRDVGSEAPTSSLLPAAAFKIRYRDAFNTSKTQVIRKLVQKNQKLQEELNLKNTLLDELQLRCEELGSQIQFPVMLNTATSSGGPDVEIAASTTNEAGVPAESNQAATTPTSPTSGRHPQKNSQADGDDSPAPRETAAERAASKTSNISLNELLLRRAAGQTVGFAGVELLQPGGAAVPERASGRTRSSVSANLEDLVATCERNNEMLAKHRAYLLQLHEQLVEEF